MPRTIYYAYRNKIDDPKLAKQKLLEEQKAKEDKFAADFALNVDKMKQAEKATDEEKQKNTFVNAEYYKRSAIECINNYMHDLSLDYRIGLIPKEYFLERLYQLKKLKADFNYKCTLPSLFLDNPEGHFEENKAVYNRMMGGYRKRWNPMTPEIMALLPDDSREAYELEEHLLKIREEQKANENNNDNNNEIIDEEDRDDIDISFDNFPDDDADDLVAVYAGPLDYKRALKIEYRNVTKEEAEALNKDLDVFVTTQIISDEQDAFLAFFKSTFKDEAEIENFYTCLTNNSISRRVNDVEAAFMVWAMGEEGMSFSESVNYIASPNKDVKVFERFKKYYRDNQVLNKTDNPAELKKAVENIVKMLENAMKKIREYKLPDIDFMDLKAKDEKAFQHYYREFCAISDICLNVNQDFIQKVLVLNNGKEDGINLLAVNAAGGLDKYSELMSFWTKCQATTELFVRAYGDVAKKDNLNRFDKENFRRDIKVDIGVKKVADYMCRRTLKRLQGKPFGEALDKDHLMAQADSMAFRTGYQTGDNLDDIPFDDICDYASGVNSRPFMDIVESQLPAAYKETYSDRTKAIASGYRTIVTEKPKHSKEVIENIIYSPSSPKEALEFLNSKDASGKTYKNYIMDMFAPLCSDEVGLLNIRETGNKLSELFLIDGKSLSELYGEKYKDIKNPDDKEWLLRVELFKAMHMQNREIQVKTFEMVDGAIYKETGYVTLLPQITKMESIVNNYNLFMTQTKDMKSSLEAYQKVLDAHKENTKEYKALVKSLKGLIGKLDYAGFVGRTFDLEKLPEEIKKLKKDIDTFAATAEEYDKPEHIANKMTVKTIKDSLDGAEELVSDLVKGMKGDILVGAYFDQRLNKVTIQNAENLVTAYNNFSTSYNKSNVYKAEELKDKLEEKKKELKAKKKYADVKKKFAEKKNLTLEEVEVLNNNVSLYNSSKQMSEFDIELSKMFTHPQNDPKVKERLDILAGVPVNNTRGSSIAKVFVAWNMGYNNMSFEAAAALMNSDRVAQSMDAFFEFCKNNTIMANKHPDKAKEAAYKWAEIMQNATNRMKEYRFPDIDYNDYEAVKPYLNEFSLLKDLSVDFVQELIQRMGNCSIRSGVGTDNKEYPLRNGKDYFEEYFGSTNTLHEMEIFWRKLQVPAGLFDAAHNVANDTTFFDRWKSGSNFTLRNNMYASAVSDVCARKYLNNLKGKTIDSISRYECSLGNVLLKVNKFSGARYQSGELGEQTAAVLDYMDGTNKGPLSEVIEKDVSKDVDVFTKGKLAANCIDSFIENMHFNEAEVAALLGIGDDAQAMLNFVNSSTGAANSHLNILNGMFAIFYARDTLNAVQSVGMDVLDLFRIDGKSAEELWGAKYNNYSRVEKQRCLKAEIVKATLQGEKEIKIQSIIIKDGKYLLSDLYTAIPKKADTVKFVENVALFSAVADKMLEKLNAFHQTLKNTQRDKNANFKNNANEGSEPYQKMCKALASALYLLKNPNHDAYSMGRIQRRLKEFHEAAEFYYKRGKTSNPARLEVAREATNDIRFYVDALADINKKSDLPLFIRSGKNACVESEFFYVKRCADDLKNYYQKSAPLPEMNQNETQEKLQGVLNLKKAQYEYRMHITSAIGGVPDSSKKLSTADAAKLLTFNQYMDSVHADYDTVQTVNQKKDLFSVDDFNNSVNELKNNKVFELFVKKYPRKAPYKWADALKKGSDIVNECRASLKSLDTLQSDIKDYVLDDRIKLTAKKNHKQKDRYDRLGEVIAKQIIIDPHNKSVPQAIGAGLVSYKDIVKACTDSLRKDNVLAYDNPAFTPENLKARITDGSLKAEVLNKISSQFTNKMKQEAKKQEPETQNAPRQSTAGPVV